MECIVGVSYRILVLSGDSREEQGVTRYSPMHLELGNVVRCSIAFQK